jgi:hypothetical protein
MKAQRERKYSSTLPLSSARNGGLVAKAGPLPLYPRERDPFYRGSSTYYIQMLQFLQTSWRYSSTLSYLGNRWFRAVNVAPASLPLGQSFWHPLNGRLGGTSEPVTTFSKTEDISYVCHESIYYHSIAVTTLTELSRLQMSEVIISFTHW